MLSRSTPPPSDLIELQNYDAIIFDLGGVILPLQYEKTIFELGQLFKTEASFVYTQAKQNDLFDQYERGEIESQIFREALRDIFSRQSGVELQPSNAQFDGAWNALLQTIPTDHLRLLAKLAESKRTFLLSNTNEIHLAKFLSDYSVQHESTYGSWEKLFEQTYYSHEMGARKPERGIYRHLIDAHHLDPKRTIFLDDNRENIRGALGAGLRATYHPTNHPLSSRFRYV